MKSVTLNKNMKEQMFHTFYRKVAAEPIEEIHGIVSGLRDEWLDLLFGSYQDILKGLPEPFRRPVTEIALPVGVMPKRKPKKRVKGKIIPTDRRTFTLETMNGSTYLYPENWRPALAIRHTCNYLDIPEEVEFYGPAWEEWTYRNWERLRVALVKDKIVKAAAIDKFVQDRFIPTVQEVDAIIASVEEAIEGVGLVLKAARTTKALRDQWPEVDTYIELPVESKGAVASLVDIHKVNEVLASAWPQEETA